MNIIVVFCFEKTQSAWTMGEKNAGILNFEITNGVKKTYLIYSCSQSVVKVAKCFLFE